MQAKSDTALKWAMASVSKNHHFLERWRSTTRPNIHTHIPAIRTENISMFVKRTEIAF
jgi:hypothetical protein